MSYRLLTLTLLLAGIVSCRQEIAPAGPLAAGELQQYIDHAILDQVESEAKIFYWNDQPDAFICEALPLTEQRFSVGVEWNAEGKRNVEAYLDAHEDLDLVVVNEQLGIYHLRSGNCGHLSALRQLSGVEYIELDYFPADISRWLDGMHLPGGFDNQRSTSMNNPGLYEPGSGPYLNFLDGIDGRSVDRAYLNNMDRVYHDLQHYGSAEAGIAVIDNGVREDRVGYFSAGPGGYEHDGFFRRNWWATNSTADGCHPLPSDIYGLWQIIEPSFNHGTGMSRNIYSLAPFAHLRTIRASPTYILVAPNQMHAITAAITALADEDNVKLISMSMAGPFGMNQVKTAIRYFNSKNKIMVCAAGSSLPILKDLLGVLFPARIPETISVSGIDNTEETSGNWQLGFFAHGGPQNDFIIENASSSSTATSTFAGMLGVLWGIDPDADREDIIRTLIDHSTFQLQQGSKHNKFGWGKVDMYQAALDIGN
jgi:hypothetical protein